MATLNGYSPGGTYDNGGQLEGGPRSETDTERENRAALRREYEFSKKDDPKVREEWTLQPSIKIAKDIWFSASYRRLDVNSTSVKIAREGASWRRHQIKPAAPKWVQIVHMNNGGGFGTGMKLASKVGKAEKKKAKDNEDINFPMLDRKFFLLLYEFNGYAKHPINVFEKEGRRYVDGTRQDEVPQDERYHRCIGPSTLKLLRSREIRTDMLGCDTVHPSDSDPDSPLLQYVFLSWYTGHFPESDLQELDSIGERVARTLGLEAYWCSSSCISTDTTVGAVRYASEVNKMSDIVRSAERVIIVLPALAGTNDEIFQILLEEWGSRVWTLPEVLLSQNEKVEIYIGRSWDAAEEQPATEPYAILSKYELANKAWPTDAAVVRQLLDHFRGNLVLSRLELSFIALRCLKHRRQGYAFPGDLTYALMGLHRLRPPIDISDSAFTAFARLSLVGDSDRLMERALCMQTPNTDRDSWLSLVDEFQSQLWHIDPECQIAAIDKDDTIILDGAYGTPIGWDDFPECFSYNAKAEDVFYGLKYSLYYFASSCIGIIVGIILLAKSYKPGSYSSYDSSSTPSTTNATLAVIGGIVISLALLFWLVTVVEMSKAPGRIHRALKKYGPKAKPSLHGIEGYMPLPALEKIIFGKEYGILKWDPYGSTLSTHSKVIVRKNTRRLFSECRGTDPSEDADIKRIIEEAERSGKGDLKVFMLVNTLTFKVTLFQARTPPCAAIVCGSEGGMKRVVLCSFDWVTETLYREAVVRMDTFIVDYMFRVPRFKFGFRRPPAEVTAQIGPLEPNAPGRQRI